MTSRSAHFLFHRSHVVIYRVREIEKYDRICLITARSPQAIYKLTYYSYKVVGTIVPSSAGQVGARDKVRFRHFFPKIKNLSAKVLVLYEQNTEFLSQRTRPYCTTTVKYLHIRLRQSSRSIVNVYTHIYTYTSILDFPNTDTTENYTYVLVLVHIILRGRLRRMRKNEKNTYM